MKNLIVTVGISNSGKTTWAEEKAQNDNWVNLNRDDLRPSVYGVPLLKQKFSKAKEKIVTEVQMFMAEKAVKAGKHIIISDTNLSGATRNKWKAFAKTHDMKYTEQVFDTPLRKCMDRNIKREYSIPPSAILQQSRQMREYMGRPVYTNKPESTYGKAIICDIDGTLAHMDRKSRSPYEWHRVGEDTVDPIVTETVRRYYNDHEIILLSGRDGCCRKETEQWLYDNNIPYDMLYMRPEGNNDNDALIKENLFWEHCAKYDIQFVLDDRDQVVWMWREIGLKVYQVEPGSF